MNVNSTDSNSFPVYMADSGQLDAFERLRVSEPVTLFDGQNQYDTSPLFWENILTGSGAVAHLPNEASIRMRVTSASGDKVIRQTREYFRYTPGKSHLIVMSRVMGIPKANTRQRIGYFDANNGLFFENDGSTFGVVQRSSTSGSPVDTRVAQSAFNLDKLDGTGKSGININLANANIFVIDLEWLGVGRTRFGVFDQFGRVQYCHEFRNANTLTVPYMSTANLPVRAELEATGTASGNTDMKNICTSVMVEDGPSALQATGLNFCANNGTSTISVTTRRAVVSIEPKATFNSIVNRGKIGEITFDLYVAGNPIFYEIIYDGTLGGSPSWNSVANESITEFDVAGTTVAGGVMVHSGYIAAGNVNNPSMETDSITAKLPLVLDSAGANPKKLSIVVTSMSGTATVAAAFHFTEVY